MLYSTNTLILNKFNFFCFPLFCGFYALRAHKMPSITRWVIEGLLFLQSTYKALFAHIYETRLTSQPGASLITYYGLVRTFVSDTGKVTT